MDEVSAMLATVDWFALVVVPALIVAARVTDVSMGTLRVVFIGRGMAKAAALAGFGESLVWLLAVSQILKHLTSPLYYVAYAGGFALGNYVGLRIESWMALGNVVVRVITNQSTEALAAVFRSAGFGATVIQGEGQTGPISMVFSVLPRKDLRAVLSRVMSVQPGAFYTVEPVATVAEGVFPAGRGLRTTRRWRQRK